MAVIALKITKTVQNRQVETITFTGTANANGTLSVVFPAGVGVTGNKVDAAVLSGDTAAVMATKWAAAAVAEDGVTDKFDAVTDNGDGSVEIQYAAYELYAAMTMVDTVGVSAASVISNEGSSEVVDAEFLKFDQIGRMTIEKAKGSSAKFQVLAVIKGTKEKVVLAEEDSFADAKTAFDTLETAILAGDTSAAVSLVNSNA